MQRLLFVIILAIILMALPLLVLSDTNTSIGDVDIQDNEVISSVSEARNASAIATITIYTGDDE